MKRVLSFVLAVMIGWGSVTQPARAFVPPAIFAAYMTATTGAGTYTMAALAGAIGITGMYLTIKDVEDNAVRIPVGPNVNNQPPAPVAPVTAAPTASTGGLPANADTVQAIWSNYDLYSCPAADGYWCNGGTVTTLQQCITNFQGGLAGRRCYVSTPTDPNYQKSYGANCSGCNSPSGTVECPSGYVVNGSSCSLDNPRQATNDKTCDILVSNGQFATANDMNCPSTVDGTKLAPMLRDGKVIAYGTNSSGQPLMWEVKPGAQTYTVTQYEQIQTATQTQIKTTTATIDATTSAVTSVQTQTSPGSMTSPSGATAPTTTADPTTATNTPTVTQDKTKSADSVTCGLPGTPACVIDDTQFEGKDNFSTPRSSEINDKLDQNKTQLENSKDSKPDISASWLPSLMPGQAAACAPLVFDFSVNSRVLGQLSAPNINLDICYYLNLVRDILGYLLGIFTVFYVWRSFTGSNQGA